MNLFGEDPSDRSGAIISECKKYRYQLWRIWDETKPLCFWVMHNPSKADEIKPDPTMTRCMNFAKSWGYGGIYLGNIIPYRATDPDDLVAAGWEACYGNWEDNLEHIKSMADKCSMHILAYGNSVFPDADFPVRWLDYNWHYLSLTKVGNPGHPLYLKGNLKPIKFKQP